MYPLLKNTKKFSRHAVVEETGENAQILVPPAEGFTARLHAKSETASKVVLSRCVSEVDA